jgi:hypothetical protein
VGLDQPVVATRLGILLVQASSLLAKSHLIPTPQIFEVQLDDPRVIEVGREIMRRVRGQSTHANDGISDFRGQAIDVLGIPGIIVSNLASTGEGGGWIGENKQSNPDPNYQKVIDKVAHSTLPELSGCMTLDSD